MAIDLEALHVIRHHMVVAAHGMYTNPEAILGGLNGAFRDLEAELKALDERLTALEGVEGE